jgi:hypothetical protein
MQCAKQNAQHGTDTQHRTARNTEQTLNTDATKKQNTQMHQHKHIINTFAQRNCGTHSPDLRSRAQPTKQSIWAYKTLIAHTSIAGKDHKNNKSGRTAAHIARIYGHGRNQGKTSIWA